MKLIKNFPFVKLNLGVKTKIDNEKEEFHDYLRTKYVVWKAYHNRGMYFYDLIKQPLLVFTGLKIWGVPFWTIFLFVPIWVFSWPIIGWFDRYKLKIWQRECEWSAREINPFEQEVLRRLRHTEEMVKGFKNKKNDK